MISQENSIAISALADIIKTSIGDSQRYKLIINPQSEYVYYSKFIRIILSKDSKFILEKLEIQQPATIVFFEHCKSLKDEFTYCVLISSEMM